MKADPRKGILIPGLSYRPQRHKTETRARPSVSQNPISEQSIQINEETILKAASIIAKKIAEEISSSLKDLSIVQTSETIKKNSYLRQEEAIKPNIQIDSSIIDVGLGKTEELQKGIDSANIVGKSSESEDNIDKDKNKLKALLKRNL